MTKKNLFVSTANYMPFDRGHGFRASYMPVFAPEGDDDGGGAGGNDDDAAAAAARAAEEAAEAAKKAAKQNKPSDAEAKLLKEAMAKGKKIQELEDKLRSFDGVDVEAFKTMMADKEAADEAKRQAEMDKLKEKGDFEALKRAMADEHKRELEAERKRLKELQAIVDKRSGEIIELTVGQEFANSNFIREDTVLTASKARRIYGDHFDYENGHLQAYDLPRGSAGREPLVDGSGNPLGFEASLKRIIDADPDKDQMLKSKSRPGSGNGPTPGVRQPARTTNAPELKGVSAIAAVLNKKA